MPRGTQAYAIHSAECRCINGIVFNGCTHCGGNPRSRATCKRCNGSGSIGERCPNGHSYSPAGTVIGSNRTSSGGNTGYGSGNSNNWQGSGKQAYGSKAGQ